MIRIAYNTPLTLYNVYLENFRLWLIEQKSPGYRFCCIKESDGTIDADTIKFIDWIVNDNVLSTLCNSKPKELIRYIDYIEREYPILRVCRKNKSQRSLSPLYNNLVKLFVTHGYSSGFGMDCKTYKLSKEELIDSTSVDVCPYCNRIYIRKQAIEKKNGKDKKVVKAELDHFYSKELYPYLAIARYNLIPSCKFCNEEGGKFTDDAYEKGMVNPYSIRNTDDLLDFKLRIRNSHILNYKSLSKGIGIHIVAKDKGIAENIDVFNLKNLNNHHTDHVADLLLKSKINGSDKYHTFLKRKLSDAGIKLTNDEIARLMVGNYCSEKDYGKRPLSKLYHDIAKELGLIKL